VPRRTVTSSNWSTSPIASEPNGSTRPGPPRPPAGRSLLRPAPYLRQVSSGLPRSVVLSLWLERIQREGVGVLPGALAAVQTEDEPHRVHGSPDLGLTLSDLAAQATFCHAVLPVPGELQAPAEAGQVALEAGEALLVRTGAGTTAFVPQVHQFGSPWEPGSQVMWQIISSSAVVPLPSSMSHARQELAHGLEVAID